MPQTLYDKIWKAHVVKRQDDGTCLIYIDRHLVHEVTSPQAFEGLRLAGRKVRRPRPDALPWPIITCRRPPDRAQGIREPESRMQVETLAENTRDFGVEYFPMEDIRQGIVHIIGPEQGFTLPRRPPSFAATAIPRRMARSARWLSASAPRKSSMCSPPRR